MICQLMQDTFSTPRQSLKRHFKSQLPQKKIDINGTEGINRHLSSLLKQRNIPFVHCFSFQPSHQYLTTVSPLVLIPSVLGRWIPFKEFQHLRPMAWRAVHLAYRSYSMPLNPRLMEVCIALGIANVFHLSLLIIFSIICLFLPHCTLEESLVNQTRVTGIVLIFVEIPLLTRICPTSEKFDTFVRRFNENWPRAGMYVGYLRTSLFSLGYWLSAFRQYNSVVLFSEGHLWLLRLSFFSLLEHVMVSKPPRFSECVVNECRDCRN